MTDSSGVVRYPETFAEEVERRRLERETQPAACSHCGHETTVLVNYSRTHGGNVGAHWLCLFCEHTQSASRLGAGGRPDEAVRDVAAMLNVLLDVLVLDTPLNTVRRRTMTLAPRQGGTP